MQNLLYIKLFQTVKQILQDLSTFYKEKCNDSCSIDCPETSLGGPAPSKIIPSAPAEKSQESPKPPVGDIKELPVRKFGRKKGTITACPHVNLPLYAMGMCNHCYHKYGRSSLATDCIHAGQKPIYAKGKCQSCYINDYNKMRRREKKQEKK